MKRKSEAGLSFMQWLDPVTKRQIQQAPPFKNFREENEKRKRRVRKTLDPKTGDETKLGIQDLTVALRLMADILENE